MSIEITIFDNGSTLLERQLIASAKAAFFPQQAIPLFGRNYITRRVEAISESGKNRVVITLEPIGVV